MRQYLIATIIIFFFQLTGHSQFFQHSILKTKALQACIAFNPTIGFEKPIFEKYSVELDFMYRNRVWNSTGREGDFGEFYNGDGFKLLIGSRLYFGKTNENLSDNQNSPFGWFSALQVAYSSATTYNIEKSEVDPENPELYYDSQKSWLNINIGIGKQFYLFQTLSLEVYAGPTYRSAYTEEFIPVDRNNSGMEFEEYRDAVITLFGTFTIGYYFK